MVMWCVATVDGKVLLHSCLDAGASVKAEINLAFLKKYFVA